MGLELYECSIWILKCYGSDSCWRKHMVTGECLKREWRCIAALILMYQSHIWKFWETSITMKNLNHITARKGKNLKQLEREKTWLRNWTRGLRPIAPDENQTIYDILQDIDRRENDFINDVKDVPYEEFSESCRL